jgi:wyosine [tRNA(Phe)-imidazoG37] synthetase (radical SAM superfamily)
MVKRKYIFGPVPSRRLGLSLGVDVIPFKTCSYNCIYCQLGKTTCLTVERKEYFPLDEIVDEIKTLLKQKINANYITLSGSGEPTLYSRIAELINSIKSITNIPIAILTNGSLLFKKEVAESLQDADLVLPSLDAGSIELFKYINRPHKSIQFDEMVEGIRSFTHHFKKEVWLEVFLVNGVNTLDADVLKLKSLIEMIKPHRVQLNTSIRPTAEDYAFQVKSEKMISIVKLLGKNVEIIAEYDNSFKQTNFKATAEDIITMLKRRPCTIDNISSSLGIHRNEAIKYLNELEKEGLINHRKKGFNYFYFFERK